MNLRGKTVLITGASRGIGRAIALEMSRQGAGRVVLVGRDEERLEDVAADLRILGTDPICLPLDLTQPVDVSIEIAQVWRDCGPIHLLVNCAGIAYQAPFLQAHLPHIQNELSTNLLGTYTVTRLVARRMAARGEGTIVNVSSLMGKVAAPTMATYSATKFALLGFTQALRSELAEHNVRVVALLPTLTQTEMVQDFQWFRWTIPVSPETVACKLVAGLRQNSSEIWVGWQSHLAIWLSRFVPGWLELALRMAAPKPHRPHYRYSRALRAVIGSN
jgi:3-oxoacyl-[acyl-carrier protein] reductase